MKKKWKWKRKPSIYLDTNIFSSLCYRGGATVAWIRQLKTAEWWELERKNYSLFTSRHTEDELSDGHYNNQIAAIAAAKRIEYLEMTTDVFEYYSIIVDAGLFPPTEYADALHLAISTFHRIDYFLTWNQAHLANVVVQKKLESVVQKNGWKSPLLVSPDSIPWASMGQAIRRKNND